MIDEEDFRFGEAYLLETDDKRYPFELFKSLTKTRPGLCITRERPDNMKKRYGLQGVDFGWLSDSGHPSSIGSDELDVLGMTVKRFISEEERVILLDGLDYLLSNNSAETVIKLLISLDQQISKYSSVLLTVLDRSELEREDLNLLKENLNFEIKRMGLTGGQKEKISGTPKDKNLVQEVREMMGFLKEQEQNLEKEVNQIKKVSSLDERELDFKNIQEAIEDLTEENRELREELKKMKKQDRKERSAEKEVKSEIADEVIATMDDEKKGIKEQVERIETEGKTEESKKEGSIDLMDTLMDLKDEVKSLREEVNEIKSGSDYEEEDSLEIKKQVSGEKVSEEEKRDLKEKREDEKIIEEGKFKDDFVMSEETEETKDIEGSQEIKPGKVVDENFFSKSEINVGSEARVNGSLEAKKDVILEKGVRVEGDITSKSGEVKIGRDCIVNGDIFGKSVFISSGSAVKDIRAEKEVVLDEETKVGEIYCQKNVNISENVDIAGEIYYGGNLNLEVKDSTIKEKTHPIEELGEEEEEEVGMEDEEEIVEERWASE